MTKRKTGKARKDTDAKDMLTEEVKAELELGTSEKYQEYVKEHARRLKQLEREAAGWNMVEPE